MQNTIRTVFLIVLLFFTVKLSQRTKDVPTLQPVVTQDLENLPLKPEANQESINTALYLYDIQVPVWVSPPTFDEKLQDRGLTTSMGVNDVSVTIGPAAFTSWALLASTLSHELEIHSRQDLGLIALIDMLTFSKRGTTIAEINAYSFEISNRFRFGLTQEEVEGIHSVMESEYPVSDEENVSKFTSFLAFLVDTDSERNLHHNGKELADTSQKASTPIVIIETR